MTILTPETRQRLARSTAAMMAMPQLMEAIAAEVDATFRENPILPQTEQARRILWALAIPQLSQCAETPEQKEKAA